MAIRYEVLSAPSLRDRLQVLSKRLFEVDATPRNLPPLVADAAKYINDAGFLFDGSSDGRDRWPAGWEFLWPFNLNDHWLLQWLDLSKDVDYARDELKSPTAEVDRDTVLAWMQAAFASHLQQWLSQCVPGMSLNPGSAFVPSEWRGKFAFRKYHWKHQGNLAASAKLIGPSEYRQFADDVATACAYLSQQLTEWLTVTESPAPKGEGKPVDDEGMDCEVARRLAEAHLARNAWPGRNALAKLIGCSGTTISKARDNSPIMREKEAIFKETQKAAKPRQLADQQRDDLAGDGDVAECVGVNELFNRVIASENDPVKRATLENMTAEKRREFVALIEHDPDGEGYFDQTRSIGRDRSRPGKL